MRRARRFTSPRCRAPLDVKPVLVPMAQLKAIFFVRDFEGNPGRVDGQAFAERQPGRRIEVTFLDDEVLLGSTLGYRPDGLGFFLTPADSEGNNLRVFGTARLRIGTSARLMSVTSTCTCHVPRDVSSQARAHSSASHVAVAHARARQCAITYSSTLIPTA